MRRLPSIDRCVIAQGLYYVVYNVKPFAPAYQFRHDSGAEFPVTDSDDSLDGLGGDYRASRLFVTYDDRWGKIPWKEYIEQKFQKLQACRAAHQWSQCVIL